MCFEPDIALDPRPQKFLNLKIALSILVFWLSVSAVPIYNNLVFSHGVGSNTGGLRPFPYPIATAFLQLAFVAVVLIIANVLGHFTGRKEDSWIFGPHFRYKLSHVAPVGFLFGFKYGATNMGLNLVPVGVHLLLQSTDVVWTVLLARIVNKEKVGPIEWLASLLSVAGSFLIGFQEVTTLEAPFIPLLVNLITPLMLAMCVSTLRLGAEELFRYDNRLHGSMTAIEFTAMKLVISAMASLALSMCFESGQVLGQTPWWNALLEESPKGLAFLFLGGVFVLIFQVNLTWLAGLTSATTVGIVSGVKVVPQWVVNALFNLKTNVAPASIGGAALMLAASGVYTMTKVSSSTLVCSFGGIRWLPREANVFAQKKLSPLQQPWLLPLPVTTEVPPDLVEKTYWL